MRRITSFILFCGLLATPLAAQVPGYVPTNGLVGYWPFNGNANDESSGSNDGVNFGATPVAGALGAASTAYSFSGSGQYIQLPDAFLGGGQVNTFTVHAKVKSNDLSNYPNIWGKSKFWGEVNLLLGNDGRITMSWANTATGNKYSDIYTDPGVITTGQWYDIEVVFSNSVGQIYLNGAPVNTNMSWGGVQNTTQVEATCNFAQDAGSSRFGARITGGVWGSYLNGILDEFCIWNRALTPAEITALHNGPIPAYVPTNGLLGWWPFNGNANDESGNGGHGTPQGAVLTTDRSGISNSAYAFDGLNDFIQTTANGPTGAAPRTITFWEKTQTSSIMTPFDYGGNGGAFQPILSNPCPGLGIDASTGVVTRGNSTVINNAWHHCALVYDPSFGTTISNVVMYIDGVVQPTITCTAVNPNTLVNTLAGVPIVFGKASSNVRYFNGAIDDIGLWGRALSASEIAALVAGNPPQVPSYVPTNGLVGWWPFTGNANDVSGNGNHGTALGAALTTDRNGAANCAYAFNGTADYITVANSGTLQFQTNNAVSLSYWMRCSSLAPSGSIRVAVSKQTDGGLDQDGWNTGVDVVNKPSFRVMNGSSTPYYQATTSQAVVTDQYYHVVNTYDNGFARIYLDGDLVFEGTSDPIALIGDNTSSLYFGKPTWVAGNAVPFHGVLDDIGIWSRALTPGEVQDLYTTPPPGIRLAAKLMLEGPYQTSTSLMNDVLRTSGLVPAVEPYTDLGYFHIGSGGNEMALPGVLATVGVNAITDWVVVELRDPDFNGFRVDTRSALLQRDGDVVDMDGVSPVTFTTTPGTYFLSIKHRNHLGVMSAAPVVFNAGITSLDFTTVSTPAFGTAARKTIGSKQVLWAGDVTGNGQMKYTGGANDRDPVLVRIGSTTPNNSVAGYFREDVNMDGVVKYTGSANDRDPILLNVGSTTPNAVRNGQVP